MIDNSFINKLIELLEYVNNKEIVYEILWSITNLAAYPQKNGINLVGKGVIPRLAELIKSGDVKIVNQAVWALGNLSCDGEPTITEIIQTGAIDNLMSILIKTKDSPLIENSCWLLSILFILCNDIEVQCMSNFISAICHILRIHNDREVIKNCCAILIEAKEDSKADIMEEMGIHNKLITLIK